MDSPANYVEDVVVCANCGEDVNVIVSIQNEKRTLKKPFFCNGCGIQITDKDLEDNNT